VKAAGIAILLLLAGAAWPAPAFDLARLMRLLGETPSSEVPYVEKKFSALLSQPVVSSGTLVYRRPDVVEKNMVAPRQESYRIAGRDLTMTRDGRQRRIALSSEPLLAASAASLRGVLSGDAKQLGEYFRLALDGTEGDWKLEMRMSHATCSASSSPDERGWCGKSRSARRAATVPCSR
jgi:Outer membrane lipoprotein carrier protein LolA-like